MDRGKDQGSIGEKGSDLCVYVNNFKVSKQDTHINLPLFHVHKGMYV